MVTIPITNDGFQLSATVASPNTLVEFASRENSLDHPATLDITTPAPEPASIPILLMAMAAIGLAVRKRRAAL